MEFKITTKKEIGNLLSFKSDSVFLTYSKSHKISLLEWFDQAEKEYTTSIMQSGEEL